MYGNTGTGKTHSMGLLNLVDGSSRGIVPDSLRYIFNLVRSSHLNQNEDAFPITKYPYLSAKCIWMKSMICWRWNLMLSWQSEKMQKQNNPFFKIKWLFKSNLSSKPFKL